MPTFEVTASWYEYRTFRVEADTKSVAEGLVTMGAAIFGSPMNGVVQVKDNQSDFDIVSTVEVSA